MENGNILLYLLKIKFIKLFRLKLLNSVRSSQRCNNKAFSRFSKNWRINMMHAVQLTFGTQFKRHINHFINVKVSSFYASINNVWRLFVSFVVNFDRKPIQTRRKWEESQKSVKIWIVTRNNSFVMSSLKTLITFLFVSIQISTYIMQQNANTKFPIPHMRKGGHALFCLFSGH